MSTISPSLGIFVHGVLTRVATLLDGGIAACKLELLPGSLHQLHSVAGGQGGGQHPSILRNQLVTKVGLVVLVFIKLE